MPEFERPSPRSARLVDVEGRMMLDSLEAKLFGGTPAPVRIGAHEVLRRLGAGGMGEVYLAFNPELRRLEAVKILRTSHGHNERAQQRLLQEARALASLSHPNIVTVYHCDIVDGNVHVAMEFIDGPTVEAWQQEERRSWRDIVRVYIAAGRGLAAAHRAGLVHRDVKPSNILLGKPTATGVPRVQVIDFGLAITRDPAASAPPAATADHRGSSLAGTPLYVSPEQCDARRPVLTARSDQFSFCVALYEALYHQHPYFTPGRAPASQEAATRRSPARVSPQLASPPPATPHADASAAYFAALFESIRVDPLHVPSDSGVPRRLFQILQRGLQRDPATRYASMDELVQQLERAVQPNNLAKLAVVGTLGVALGGGVIAYAQETVPARCSNLSAELADVWNPGRAAAVAEALRVAAGDNTLAASAARVVERDLEAYAAEWTRVLGLACGDTYTSGKIGEDTYRRRLQCLDVRRSALADAVAVLADDPAAVRHTDAILATLPPVGDCAALDVPRCGDPDDQGRVPGLPDAMARARADERGGRFAAAAEQAARAAELAAGDPPLLAEAAFLHGRMLAELGRWEGSEAALLIAHNAAERAGCDELTLDVTNRLAKSVALDGDPGRPSTDWSPFAFARLERVYGADGKLREGRETGLYQLRKAEIYNNRGLLRLRKQRDPACVDAGGVQCPPDRTGALGDFDEALRLRRLVTPAPLAELANSERNRGAALFGLGHHDEALAAFEAGLELAREAHGDGSPALWKAHFDLGKALAGAGRIAEAETHLRDALRLVELGHEPGDLKIGEAHLELAVLYDDAGDAPRVRSHAEGASRIFESLPITHPRRFNALRMLGKAYMDTDALDDALALREQLLAATPHNDLEELLASHVELAETLDAQARWADAFRHAELASGLADTLDLPLDDVYRGEVALYRGLAADGLKRPDAVDTLRQAEAILSKNSAEGVIDRSLWVHAAWAVTRATCSPVPDLLRAALAPASPHASTDARLRGVADAIARHDPMTCAQHPER